MSHKCTLSRAFKQGMRDHSALRIRCENCIVSLNRKYIVKMWCFDVLLDLTLLVVFRKAACHRPIESYAILANIIPTRLQLLGILPNEIDGFVLCSSNCFCLFLWHVLISYSFGRGRRFLPRLQGFNRFVKLCFINSNCREVFRGSILDYLSKAFTIKLLICARCFYILKY